MAFIDDNDLTTGIRGGVGKQLVFRRYKKQTVVSRKAKPGSLAPSPEQSGVRSKFLSASRYASTKLLEPEIKAEYTLIARMKDSSNAYATAVGDYLKATKLMAIQTDQFKGQSGFQMPIKLEDNFKAKEMSVSISNKDGTVGEQGSASFVFGDKAWMYTTTAAYASISGLKITVTVLDRPGNVTTFEKTL